MMEKGRNSGKSRQTNEKGSGMGGEGRWARRDAKNEIARD